MSRKGLSRLLFDLVVVLLAGLLGAGIASRLEDHRISRVNHAENTVITRGQGQQQQANTTELDAVNQQLQAAQSRAAACEAAQTDANSRLTVLYDISGSAQPAIQLFHGMVNISSPMLPAQARPRWLIPAKVTPVVVGSTTSIAYAYFNPQSKTIEGPFVPQTDAAAEGAQQ